MPSSSDGKLEDSTIKTLGRWESTAYQWYIRIPRELLASYTCTLAAWCSVIAFLQFYSHLILHLPRSFCVDVLTEGTLMWLTVSLSSSTMQLLQSWAWEKKPMVPPWARVEARNPPLLMKKLSSQALDFTGYLWTTGPISVLPPNCTDPPLRSVVNTARVHAKIASSPGSPRLGTRLGKS